MIADLDGTREHPTHWRTAPRDAGIVLVLFFVAFQLFAQAERRQPKFTADDIRVVEGVVSEFTTVQVWETAAAPQINSQTLVGRTAMRLEGRPPNVLSYIHGSGWRIDNDIPVGTVVRLEVVEDPDALIARARANTDATFLQPIEGLQAGERVYFRAIEEITRAEESVRFFQRLGLVSLLVALGWLGWAIRRRWGDVRHAVAAVRGS